MEKKKCKCVQCGIPGVEHNKKYDFEKNGEKVVVLVNGRKREFSKQNFEKIFKC